MTFLFVLLSVVLSIFVPIDSEQSIDSIPIPTTPQYEYQSREIMGLTHFNMVRIYNPFPLCFYIQRTLLCGPNQATYFVDGDPACNKRNWAKSGDPQSFDPYALNVSSWVESYVALGAKSAVLTAKHGVYSINW